MDLPYEAIGPEGSSGFLRGVHTSISKKTRKHIATCDFLGGWGLDPLFAPLDRPMDTQVHVAGEMQVIHLALPMTFIGCQI